jgi:hypothetical protein
VLHFSRDLPSGGSIVRSVRRAFQDLPNLNVRPLSASGCGDFPGVKLAGNRIVQVLILFPSAAGRSPTPLAGFENHSGWFRVFGWCPNSKGFVLICISECPNFVWGTVPHATVEVHEGALVPAYRLYKITDANRIAGPPTMIECDSDAEVVTKAKAMLDGLDIEIWDGQRVVARLSIAHPK